MAKHIELIGRGTAPKTIEGVKTEVLCWKIKEPIGLRATWEGVVRGRRTSTFLTTAPLKEALGIAQAEVERRDSGVSHIWQITHTCARARVARRRR